jgi:transposase
MGKMRGTYTPEFRRQMVELVRAGRSPEELAGEFEPTAQSIRNWQAQAARNAGRGDGGLTTAEREELNRLRRENRQLKLEREILSKAAAWFARETNTIPPKGSGS